MISPARLLGLVARAKFKGRLFVFGGVRILLGLVLIFAASASKTPDIFRILGGLTILAGLVLPVFGERRFEALINWASSRSPGILRLFCLAGAAFGAYILWAALP